MICKEIPFTNPFKGFFRSKTNSTPHPIIKTAMFSTFFVLMKSQGSILDLQACYLNTEFSRFSNEIPCFETCRIWVFTAVVMKSTIFWDITPHSPSSVNRRFRGAYRRHLLSRWFLAHLNFSTLIWRRYVPPKRRLTLNADYTALRWYSSGCDHYVPRLSWFIIHNHLQIRI
jgi:hypothetical protein